MHAYELNLLTKEFTVKSGHSMCHPETCNCWEFRVYNADGKNVLNTDSSLEVKKFCGL